jgi:putative long chain acyl-CoA synthase
MPRGLWRRVERRFAPARVLEFYASTEAGAILVNLSSAKPGSMGRPLPGSAEVRIARYDMESAQLVLGQDGLAVECRANEIGMLMARVEPHEPLSTVPLRGVFSRDDAWLMTGDLFRRDPDGDYWRIDNVADVIHTAEGAVFAGPIRDALGDLPAVDLAVAYGVKVPEAQHQMAIAAVTLRADQELEGPDIAAAMAALPETARPAIVQVVARIPVTTWFRPITGPLREAGIPEPGPSVWSLDPETGDYRPGEPAVTAAISEGERSSA